MGSVPTLGSHKNDPIHGVDVEKVDLHQGLNFYVWYGPASRAISSSDSRICSIRMGISENQVLNAPRLDTTAGTLISTVEMVTRDLPPGFSMKKWPGYSADSGRTRFQRRIPEDVRHAFHGAEWIRIPLNLPPGREAQRRAFGWWVAYEGEFNRIRQGDVGKSTNAGEPAATHLSSLTLDQMREMFMPVADRLHLGHFEQLITGAKPHEDLVIDYQKLAEEVRKVVSGRGSTHLSFLAGLFLLSRKIAFDPLEPSFKCFVYETAVILDSGFVHPVGKRRQGEVVESPTTRESENVGAGLQIPLPNGLTLGEVVDG